MTGYYRLRNLELLLQLRGLGMLGGIVYSESHEGEVTLLACRVLVCKLSSQAKCWQNPISCSCGSSSPLPCGSKPGALSTAGAASLSYGSLPGQTMEDSCLKSPFLPLAGESSLLSGVTCLAQIPPNNLYILKIKVMPCVGTIVHHQDRWKL